MSQIALKFKEYSLSILGAVGLFLSPEQLQVNSLLFDEHDALQKATNIHNQLTSLVLEGHGLEMIAHNLGIIVNRPVIIADHIFHIMSIYQDNTDLDLKEIWQNAIQDSFLKYTLSLFEENQFNDDYNHIDICYNSSLLKIFVA